MRNRTDSVRRTCGLAVAILFAAGGVGLDRSWGASWSEVNTGLPGAGLGVTALAIDPASPSIIYAQTVSITLGGPQSTTGLFKTTDGGGSWKAVSSALGVNSVVIDPKNSSTLYASTDQGIVKSTNGGASWSDASDGLPSGSVTRLVIDPLTPTTLYAVVFAGATPFVPSFTPPMTVIFKSTNGGASWNALDAGLPPGAFASALVIDPATPSTLYLPVPPFGGPPGPEGGPPRGTLLKSTDGGESWRALDTGQFAFFSNLLVDPKNSSTLYALAPPFPAPGGGPPVGGILKSTDGGESWKTIGSSLPPNTNITFLAIDPAAASTIYAAATSFTPPGPPSWVILKSTDDAQHWNALSLSLPANTLITSLAFDPVTPSRMYVTYNGFFGGPFGAPASAASGGVFKSTDGGGSWSEISAGLSTFDIRTLAMNRTQAATVYAGGSSGVFKTTDGGATWNATGLTSTTGSLVADFLNPNLVYAQTGRPQGCNSDEALLYRSTDGGANWSNTVSPANSGCILNASFFFAHVAPLISDPTDANKMYMAESDDQDGYSAILKTTDGGTNWTVSWDWFTGLRVGVRVLAIDPARPAILYAGFDDGSALTPAVEPNPGGLYKSTDGGATWSKTTLAGSAVNLIAIDPSNSNIVYAATEGHYSKPKGFQGLFKSTDGGARWQAIGKGLESVTGTRLTTSTALKIDPANANILYLGTSNGGVFRSTDGGVNWSAYNDGLGNLQIRALVLAPGNAHTVYAGTPGGVFKLLDQ